MQVIRTIAEMQAQSRSWSRQGIAIGLVPTMGFLHEGHLSLVDIAKEKCGAVVASIFVNPMQFGPKEDFDNYPRDEARDLAMLEAHGTDVVFIPQTDEMYPKGFETRVELTRLPNHLCGLRREGHFRGVTTVVLKLLAAVQPDVAVFGDKDYQQILVIRRMVCDLNLSVEVIAGPTVREPDGLAMSSRNSYLSPEERRTAACVFQALQRARQMVNGGAVDPIMVRRSMTEAIEQNGAQVDYVAVVDPETLEELQIIKDRAHAAVAAFVGRTRLIDNLRLKG
ncbi:MAG: pantoate--beta-alanine ligase [Deltaproteobacteria bacterium]|nr:pantoate--beta-alanine ligase [Deltaproteobacteria bacterium]